MAVQPRIGLSGSRRTSGSAEDLVEAPIARWTSRTMLLAAATLLVLFGVVDVAAVRSGECGSPRDGASGTAISALRDLTNSIPAGGDFIAGDFRIFHDETSTTSISRERYGFAKRTSNATFEYCSLAA